MDTMEIAEALAKARVRPLWEIPPPGKHTPPDAYVWTWRDIEPLAHHALTLTSPDVVERRALNLISPAATGAEFFTAPNLNAAIQILKPGEAARPHRHSMHALRFVLEGSGAVTIVNGKACTMSEGDLLLTPGWCWHQHEHPGAAPILWLDVLDVPFHLYLGTDRFEPGPPHDVVPYPAEAALASPGIVPSAIEAGDSSPMFLYPLADARRAVQAAPAGRDGLRRVRYTNPLTGGAVMATLDCYLIEIAPNTASTPFRTTANAVATVVSGSGTTTVDGTPFAWGARDVLSLPHGHWVTHVANDEPAYLFVASDRDVYRRLGFLTEEFGA